MRVFQLHISLVVYLTKIVEKDCQNAYDAYQYVHKQATLVKRVFISL